VSFESDSNVNDEREEQPPKHSLQRTSTDDGIQIDSNMSQSENAFDAIRVSFESDSNVTDEREEQQEKHSLQRTSTDDGIQTDSNISQWENASNSI
jgi:hypothetical protein